MDWLLVLFYVCSTVVAISVAVFYLMYYKWWNVKAHGQLFASDYIWISGFVAQFGSFAARNIAANVAAFHSGTWRDAELWLGNLTFCWFMILPAIRIVRYYP